MNAIVDNQLLSLTDIQNGLGDKKLYVVSRATGLSYPTLKKLADGEPGNYTMGTLRKVSEYIIYNRISL